MGLKNVFSCVLINMDVEYLNMDCMQYFSSARKATAL